MCERLIVRLDPLTEGGLFLEGLRHDETFSDVVLMSNDGEKIPAHRVVLAACSGFFHGLFVHSDSSISESAVSTACDSATQFGSEKSDSSRGADKSGARSGIMKEVQLQVPADVINMVLDFAYTGKVKCLRFWDVERLLPLADKWIIPGLVEICCGVLRDSLRVDNCIGIWRFARAYTCVELERRSKRFILYHMWSMIVDGQSTEAFRLTGEELKEFLDEDLLNVPDENGTFFIIRQWILRNQKRKKYLPMLVRTMRLGLCSTDFIEEQLLTDALFQSSSESVEFLHRARIELSEETILLRLDRKLLRPRIPQDILFAIGGWADRSPTCCIETYDSKADRWFLCNATDCNPRAYHGLAVVNQKIYVVGGFDGTDYYNSVRCFDPEQCKWKEAAPMYWARCYVSVAVLHGQVYAVGGFDGRIRLTSAEKLDPETNQWTLISSLNQARSDASAAAFRGKIYVAGGFNGHEVLRSVEVYSPDSDVWVLIADTLSPRSGVSMATDEESLFIIGGFNGHNRLTTGERYNPETMSWTMISEMRTARSNFAATVLDGKILVIGGFNGQTTTSEVECYDPKRDQWGEIRAITLNRSAVKACVVSGLQNAESFSFHGHQKQIYGDDIQGI